MKIVHSKINPGSVSAPQEREEKTFAEMTDSERFEYKMALKGFKRAVKEMQAEILEIRETIPGWEPEFKYPIYK